MSDKSYVTMLRCPWCKEDTGELALDRKLREKFERYTDDAKPCDKCLKDAVLLYDADTKKFLAYIKKKAMLTPEAMEQYKDTPVKALGKVNADGTVTFSGGAA